MARWSAPIPMPAGFYAPIAGLDLAGQPVVVIGAGGAARAILFALARVGVGRGDDAQPQRR